jgi:hypothetical protein
VVREFEDRDSSALKHLIQMVGAEGFVISS